VQPARGVGRRHGSHTPALLYPSLLAPVTEYMLCWGLPVPTYQDDATIIALAKGVQSVPRPGARSTPLTMTAKRAPCGASVMPSAASPPAGDCAVGQIWREQVLFALTHMRCRSQFLELGGTAGLRSANEMRLLGIIAAWKREASVGGAGSIRATPAVSTSSGGKGTTHLMSERGTQGGLALGCRLVFSLRGFPKGDVEDRTQA
jgi:hypothetical protein